MRWIPLLLLFWFPACVAVPPAIEPIDAETPAESDEPVPPRDEVVDPQAEVWVFLRKKYDIDRDGTVTLVEYDRGEASFKRLDRDGNGELTRADFKGGGRMSPERRNAMIAQRAVMRTFQSDDNPRELTLEELGARFAVIDADGDGMLLLAEFEVVAKGTQAFPVQRQYGALVAVADKDADGNLTQVELVAFFRARDGNDDGVWSMGGGKRAASGVAAGEMAPDFTLRPPGGGEAVTLSSFRGQKPVALIFGSYT